jgi:Neutral/alkaline non-lysosomal ceramidase, N-terminal
LFARALVIDDGQERVCFVTLDLMATDTSLMILSHALAAGQGFSVPADKVTYTGSHTHSGLGAWMTGTAIQITPTMDLYVPNVQLAIAQAIAHAMVEAEQSMVAAKLGSGHTELAGVTRNRRAKISPYVNSTTVDTTFSLLRVDNAASGAPIATMWGFACHGTCYGADNMKRSADIMGVANKVIETQLGGVALFLQGDAGDVSPAGGQCDNKPMMTGGVTMGNTALQLRSSLATFASGELATASVVHDMGPTSPDWTLAQTANCTTGGPYNICSICAVIDCSLNWPLGQGWVDETLRFNSVRLTLNGKHTAFSTCPFEAITEFGMWVRNDTSALGFDETFFVGYTGYAMYLVTPREWSLVPNGYEAMLTIWGEHEADTVRSIMFDLNKQVAPPS